MSKPILVKLMEHASQCGDVSCSHPTECNKMKHMIRHIARCQLSECEICSGVSEIISMHSQMCCLEVCPVIRCDEMRKCNVLQAYSKDLAILQDLKMSSQQRSHKVRGVYKCGQCGQPKLRRHQCEVNTRRRLQEYSSSGSFVVSPREASNALKSGQQPHNAHLSTMPCFAPKEQRERSYSDLFKESKNAGVLPITESTVFLRSDYPRMNLQCSVKQSSTAEEVVVLPSSHSHLDTQADDLRSIMSRYNQSNLTKVDHSRTHGASKTANVAQDLCFQRRNFESSHSGSDSDSAEYLRMPAKRSRPNDFRLSGDAWHASSGTSSASCSESDESSLHHRGGNKHRPRLSVSDSSDNDSQMSTLSSAGLSPAVSSVVEPDSPQRPFARFAQQSEASLPCESAWSIQQSSVKVSHYISNNEESVVLASKHSPEVPLNPLNRTVASATSTRIAPVPSPDTCASPDLSQTFKQTLQTAQGSSRILDDCDLLEDTEDEEVFRYLNDEDIRTWM